MIWFHTRAIDMPGAFLNNYIVRIYRCKRDNPRRLVGVVEEVGVKGNKAFTNFDELWEILNTKKRGQRKRVRKGSTENNLKSTETFS
jgi:hypothetical protein